MSQEQHKEDNSRPEKKSDFLSYIFFSLLVLVFVLGSWVYLEYSGLAPFSLLPRQVTALWEDKGAQPADSGKKDPANTAGPGISRTAQREEKDGALTGKSAASLEFKPVSREPLVSSGTPTGPDSTPESTATREDSKNNTASATAGSSKSAEILPVIVEIKAPSSQEIETANGAESTMFRAQINATTVPGRSEPSNAPTGAGVTEEGSTTFVFTAKNLTPEDKSPEQEKNAQNTVPAGGPAIREKTGGVFSDLPAGRKRTTSSNTRTSDNITMHSRALTAPDEFGAVRGKAVAGATTPPPTTRTRQNIGSEDSQVRYAFIDSVARNLAENYWPRGTHLQAKGSGISTASLKWANAHYGRTMEGFSPALQKSEQGRAKLLNYALMPSMIDALSRMYTPAFITSLEKHARSQLRGPQGAQRPLTESQLAEMYGIYANKAFAIASTIRSYNSGTEIDNLVRNYLAADNEAVRERHNYFNSRQPGSGSELSGNAYQIAVVRREHAKNRLAASLRRNANTRGLDEDSLVYLACWLHRRPAAAHPGLESLAKALIRIGGELKNKRTATLQAQGF